MAIIFVMVGDNLWQSIQEWHPIAKKMEMAMYQAVLDGITRVASHSPFLNLIQNCFSSSSNLDAWPALVLFNYASHISNYANYANRASSIMKQQGLWLTVGTRGAKKPGSSHKQSLDA